MKKENVIICPPCGENVALATKRGALNKESFFTTLLPRLTAVLPQSGKTCLTTLLPGYAVLPPQGGKIERHNSNLASQGREITARGFTLIELLVVVLIIGILAAVAVPQYQKAVEKSRAMQAVALLKSIIPALESYYVANGSFPTSFDEFDMELPADWNGNEYFTTGNISDTKSNSEWAIGLDSANSNWYAVQIGHWTGNYKGAGFAYYVTSAWGPTPKEILCTEIIDYGVPFEKEAGAFCEKLFNATLLVNTVNQRFYTFQ